jgi:hypothetical protein
MANINNVKIEVNNYLYLDYLREDQLAIKLNRIVDDFQNPTKRFGEFSYTLSLPRTKNNDSVFEYPDVKGRINIFVGKIFDCRVYNNNELLLDGIIELSGIDEDTYNCQFYSKITQLIDDIGSTFVSNLKVAKPVLFNPSTTVYENLIINHINAEYKNADETDYQFPLIFYRTMFAPAIVDPTYSTFTRTNSPYSNLALMFNSAINSPYKTNWFYYHQLPPAFYMINILKKIFDDAGWSLGGSWKDRPEIKKIIIPFAGAKYDLKQVFVSGSTYSVDFNIALPKIKCIDFFKNIVNAFNLYFKIDVDSKTLILEPYDIMFANTANVYVIDKKIDQKTITKTKVFDYDSQIVFKEDGNNKIFGLRNSSLNETLGNSFIGNGLTADLVYTGGTRMLFGDIFPFSPFGSQIAQSFSDQLIDSFNNKLSGNKKIDVGFTSPSFNRMQLASKNDINGSARSGGQVAYQYINIPAITKQTVSKNEGYIFSPETGSTFLDNKPDTMQYAGGLTMLYYYGKVRYNGNAISTTDAPDLFSGQFRNWAYINIATGGGGSSPTGQQVHIPYASPYRLMNNRDKDIIMQKFFKDTLYTITGFTSYLFNENIISIQAMEMFALIMTYYMAGATTDSYETTDYSLIYCEDEGLLYNNLYTKYYKEKFNNIADGFYLKAKMRMDVNDWREMQINRCLSYNDETYRLVAIKNYDPIARTADIELLKLPT